MMSKEDVKRLVSYWGLALPAGATLFDIIFEAAKLFLGHGDEAALAIAHKRIPMYDSASENDDLLLDIDAAIQCMDANDHDKYYDEPEACQKTQAERREYAGHYVHRRKATAKAVAVAAKAKAKGKAKAAPKPPAQYKLPSEIPHTDAKIHIPPKTSCWHGFTRGEWWGHCEPYGRVKKDWANEGSEHNAFRAMLKVLWTQYIELNGFENSACPVEGLL